MKRLLSLMLLVAVVFVSFASFVAADDPNYWQSTVARPAYLGSTAASESRVSVQPTAVGTISASNNRIGGYVQNLSTAVVILSMVNSSTTTINTGGGIVLKPYGSSDNSDRYYFRDGNVIYTGPLYAAGVSSVTFIGNEGFILRVNELKKK